MTGVTIFLALQISVKYNMFKMSKTSYNPLQTVGSALTSIVLLKIKDVIRSGFYKLKMGVTLDSLTCLSPNVHNNLTCEKWADIMPF